MRIVITGATGFIGRSMAERSLRDGHEVHLLTRAGSRSTRAIDELRLAGATVLAYADYSELRDHVAQVEPEVVFHLATHYTRSHHAHDIESMIDANVQLGTHLLESLKGTSAVIVSTISYFQFRHGQPVAHSLYSSTKQAFSEVCRYYREIEDLDIREVILFDTYGSEDSRPKLIPLLMASAKSGDPVQLGSPEQLINLLHVDDVVEGLVAAAGPDSPALMSVKASRETTVHDLVERIHSISGKAFPTQFRSGATPSLHVLEAGNWPTPPGWQPTIELDEGLRTILETGG